MNLSVFKNFEPTGQVQSYLNFIIKQVSGMIPKAQATTSMIVRQGSRYLCLLEITTESGLFKTSTFGANPILALDKARRELLNQAGSWGMQTVLSTP